MFLLKHTTPSGYSAGNILLYSLSVAPHLLCPRLLQVPSILLYLGEISLDSSVLSRIDNNLSLTMHVVNPFFLHRSPLLKQIISCHVMSCYAPDINILVSHWADSNFLLTLPNIIIDYCILHIPTSFTQLPVRGFFLGGVPVGCPIGVVIVTPLVENDYLFRKTFQRVQEFRIWSWSKKESSDWELCWRGRNVKKTIINTNVWQC